MEQQLNAYMNQYEQLIKTIEDTNNKLNNTAQNQQNNDMNMLCRVNLKQPIEEMFICKQMQCLWQL